MSLFLKLFSQIITVLTAAVTSLTQIWVKKVQIGISCTNVERYFEVNYSFMKPFSQHSEVLT